METKTNGNGYVKWSQLVTITLTLFGMLITLGIFMGQQAIETQLNNLVIDVTGLKGKIVS